MTFTLPDDIRVVAADLAPAPDLEIPSTGALPAEIADAGPWREEDVRRYIRWACDAVADMTGEETDRAADWEVDLTAPGATRMLNRYAPWVGTVAKKWVPGGGDNAWPDWMGIVLMAAARAAPRILEGRAVDWVQSWRRRRTGAISAG